MEIKARKKNRKRRAKMLKNPARVIVVSFLIVIAAGTLLLMMPFCSASGKFTPFLDALFTATSATCVTGLVVVDTGTYFSVIGQSVILLLIQIGGLGLVTFATFFNVLLHRRLKYRSMNVAMESISASSMSDVAHLVRVIFIFSLSFECLGALILSTVFVPQYGAHGVFISAFLSVSAFCNGGFDILGFQTQFCSVTNYWDSPVVLCTLMALIVCGGLGFVVWQDLYRYKYTHRLLLHTRLVMAVTAVLIAGGTLAVLLCEWNNPDTLGQMPFLDKLLNSAFLSVSTRTAGFNSFSVNDMRDITKLFCVLLMFIGAAPASTGGGIKITTAVVLFMTVFCALRDAEDTVICKHRISKNTVYKAMAITFVGFTAVCITTLVLLGAARNGSVSLIDALFEAASAFGTVGITAGVTAAAGPLSRILLILNMFLGRVGPLVLGLSITVKSARSHEASSTEVLPEGKIMVG